MTGNRRHGGGMNGILGIVLTVVGVALAVFSIGFAVRADRNSTKEHTALAYSDSAQHIGLGQQIAKVDTAVSQLQTMVTAAAPDEAVADLQVADADAELRTVLDLGLTAIRANPTDSWAANTAATTQYNQFVRRVTYDSELSVLGPQVAARLLKSYMAEYNAIVLKSSTVADLQDVYNVNAVELLRQIEYLNSALRSVDRTRTFAALSLEATRLTG